MDAISTSHVTDPAAEPDHPRTLDPAFHAMRKTPKHPFYWRFSWERSCEYLVLFLSPVEAATNPARNWSYDLYQCAPSRYYTALSIRAQCTCADLEKAREEKRPLHTALYGYEIQYNVQMIYELRIDQMKCMIATLNRIQNNMRKVRDKFGHEMDIAGFIRYAKEAIGPECLGYLGPEGAVNENVEITGFKLIDHPLNHIIKSTFPHLFEESHNDTN